MGQHCGLAGHTGGIEGQGCAVTVFLQNFAWKYMQGDEQRIQYGVSGGNPVVPMFTARDHSLDGYQSMISPLLNGFFNVSGCKQMLTRRWAFSSGCMARARRLSLWGGHHWNQWSEGLPHYYLPDQFKSHGAHVYSGKTYYVGCSWNGCRAWNKPAFDCHDGLYQDGENGCDTSEGQFAFGQPRLRGAGYDAQPFKRHDRSHFEGGWLFGSSLLGGVNGGYLSWDLTSGGYNAVVLEGHSYEIENTASDIQLTMTVSDPIMDEVASPGFPDVVSLCVKGGGPFRSDGADAACWLTASDDRSFVAKGLKVSPNDPTFENWTIYMRTEVNYICGSGEPDGSTCSAQIKVHDQDSPTR